ncbi:MAG: PHP domain-containing protein [Candidatus Omnitrophica bacterium]|nr:PHP domain-containing protein [Candidatus Omnitrophota bacterium]
MPPVGPLIALHTAHDPILGVVPVELLVQAAVDAGYRALLLADEGTLRGATQFARACRERAVHPLVGTILRVGAPPSSRLARLGDVFDLGEHLAFPDPGPRFERFAFIALNRKGYQNLLRLVERRVAYNDQILPTGEVTRHQEGLFLLLGSSFSSLRRRIEARDPIRLPEGVVEWIEGWPRDRIGYGGLDLQEGGASLNRQLAQISKLPGCPPPMAVTWGAYRWSHERFWGLAKGWEEGGESGPWLGPGVGIPPRAEIERALEGLSASIRLVERVVARSEDPFPKLPLSLPAYPTPRGTDVASFVWTLAQEAAISTGHIRAPGGKERMMEEFQFLKQTAWPLVWAILWDARRQLGLSPGVLRPTAEWIGTSLLAHLLGMTRIDPLRERIPFRSEAPQPTSGGGLLVGLEGPLGWEERIQGALVKLLGEHHGGRVPEKPLPDREAFLLAGRKVLTKWEDLGFSGDRPKEFPPLPLRLLGRAEESNSTDSEESLLLTGGNLAHLLAGVGEDSCRLDLDPGEALNLGGLVLRISSPVPQTLAAAPAYRGVPEQKPHTPPTRETLTHWIEARRGAAFTGRGYSDDSGRIDILGWSSCLLRLLTLPGSGGYRPLLRHWIEETRPTRLGELADLLALQWHVSYWAPRVERRLAAITREHPLRSPGGSPPWWEDWKCFLAESRIDSKTGGDLSSNLEKWSAATGGWLLYREQLEGALQEALEFTPEEVQRWLEAECEPSLFDKDLAGIQDRRVRAAFLRFLGNPFPLPRRLEFLRLAEGLLGAADSFAADPAAVASALSFLFPEEVDERREVYALLQFKGVTLLPPRLGVGSLHDRSSSPDHLVVGTLNLDGVGRQIGADFDAAPADSVSAPTIWDLYASSSNAPGKAWRTWLQRSSPARIPWRLLEQLIRVGYFPGGGRSPTRLEAEARAHWRGGQPLSRRDQATLFALTASDGDGESMGLSGHSVLKDLERIGALGTPLRSDQAGLPPKWFSGEQAPTGRLPFLFGWCHEADIFPVAGPTPERDNTVEETRVRIEFLLVSENGAYRVSDKRGLLAPSLRVPFEAPRPEGRRLFLRDPARLLCRVARVPTTGTPELAVYELLEVERLEEIRDQAPSWIRVRVGLQEAPGELLTSLSEMIDWFGEGEWSVPLHFENEASVLRRGSVRRFIRRMGAPRVLASRLLTAFLGELPGVRTVQVGPGQAEIFHAG